MFKGTKTPIVFIVLLVLNLFLISLQINHNGENVFKFLFFKATSPMMHLFFNVKDSFEYAGQILKSKKDLVLENKKLKKELFTYKAEKFLCSRIRAENEVLKRLLYLKVEDNFSGVVCEVISKKFDIFSSSITIFCDDAKEIRDELPVISYDGLVGYVFHRSKSIAEVELITNSGTAISVVIDKKNIRGIAYGTGRNVLDVNYIPYSKKVNVGDIFITSGDDRIYPRGIPVGVVADVKRSGEIFQKITIIPIVDFSKLEYVFVLIPNKGVEKYGN